MRHDADSCRIVVDENVVVIGHFGFEEGYQKLQIFWKWLLGQVDLFNFALTMGQKMEHRNWASYDPIHHLRQFFQYKVANFLALACHEGMRVISCRSKGKFILF